MSAGPTRPVVETKTGLGEDRDQYQQHNCFERQITLVVSKWLRQTSSTWISTKTLASSGRLLSSVNYLPWQELDASGLLELTQVFNSNVAGIGIP
jgi:hypothetical protein